MMTAAKLFLRRLVSEWKYQFEVWTTVVDWVVALYIVIPFLGLFLQQYLSWWRKIPEWLVYTPLNVLLGIIVLFTWSGTIRIFVEDADQLFLLQQKTWIRQIKKYSLGYSIVINLFTTSLVIIVIAPLLLRHYGFSFTECVWLVLFTFVFKTAIGIGKQLTALHFKGLIQRLVMFVLLLITGTYYRLSMVFLLSHRSLFYLSALVLLTTLILLLYRRVSIRGTFSEDVSREQDAKLKLANLFLQIHGTQMKKPKISRKRPLLFRNSNLLFRERTPVNGLVELTLKTVLRNSKHVTFYLQLIGGCLLMILAAPPIWKLLLWVAFLIILTFIVWLYWQEAVNSPFVSLFSWLRETKVAAASKAVFLMALPGQMIISLVVVLQIHSGLSGIVMLPLGILIGYVTAKFIPVIKA